MMGLTKIATVIKSTLCSIQIRSSRLSGTSIKHADATFYPQFYQAQQPVPSTPHSRLWVTALSALPTSITNNAQQVYLFALPYKSTELQHTMF